MLGSKSYLNSKGDGAGTIPPFRYNYESTNEADAKQTINAEWKLSESGTFSIKEFVAYAEKDAFITSTDLLCAVTSTNSALVISFWRTSEPLAVTEIVVTNVQNGIAAMPFVPPVPRNTITKDFRFSESNPQATLAYVVVNKSWPSLNSIRTLYLKQIYSPRRFSDINTARRGAKWIIWILFIGMSLPFAVILWKQINNKQRR